MKEKEIEKHFKFIYKNFKEINKHLKNVWECFDIASEGFDKHMTNFKNFNKWNIQLDKRIEKLEKVKGGKRKNETSKN